MILIIQTDSYNFKQTFAPFFTYARAFLFHFHQTIRHEIRERVADENCQSADQSGDGRFLPSAATELHREQRERHGNASFAEHNNRA